MSISASPGLDYPGASPLLLSAGSLADRAGARRWFGAGMVVFVAASVACGLAPGLGVQVAARLVQGCAAAVMMPSSTALISHAYPDPVRRAHAVALWSMGGVAASTSGPVLGGLLTLVSWRLIFFVNVPAGLAALVLLARSPQSPGHSVPFDWAGQIAAVLAMGGLTYGAIETGAAGSPRRGSWQRSRLPSRRGRHSRCSRREPGIRCCRWICSAPRRSAWR
jgi:MFS transporter, DHA2 family, methylenomycin A resistance protein